MSEHLTAAARRRQTSFMRRPLVAVPTLVNHGPLPRAATIPSDLGGTMVRRACQRRLAGVSRVAFMSVLGRPMLVVASSLFLGACSQPTQPVTAEPLADSTSASSTQHGGADKARLASDLGLTEPPEVAPVRHITPRESQEVYTGCLQDAGWSESGPDEGIEIPAGQQESFNLAYYVCLQQYPVEEKYTQPLTTERLGPVRLVGPAHGAVLRAAGVGRRRDTHA